MPAARLALCAGLWASMLGCQLPEVQLELPAHEGLASCFLAIDNHHNDNWHVEALALEAGTPIITTAIEGARLVLLYYARPKTELVASPPCALLPPDKIYRRELLRDEEWIEEAEVVGSLRTALVPEGASCQPVTPCTAFEITEVGTFPEGKEVKAVVPQADGSAWILTGSLAGGAAYTLDANQSLSPMAWPTPAPPSGALRLKDGRTAFLTDKGEIFRVVPGGAPIRATTSSTAPPIRAWLAEAETNDDLFLAIADETSGHLYRLTGDVLTELATWPDERAHTNLIPYKDGVRFLRPRTAVFTVRGSRPVEEPVSLGLEEVVFGLGRLEDGTTVLAVDEGPLYWDASGRFTPTPDQRDYLLVRVTTTLPFPGGLLAVSGIGDFAQWRRQGGYCDRYALTRSGLRTLTAWGGGFLIGSQTEGANLARLYYARALP